MTTHNTGIDEAMSNQDRLLSDDELKAAVQNIIAEMDAKSVRFGNIETFSLTRPLATSEIVDLINTQKRLYAERVIGEDKKQKLDHDEGYCINCNFQATDGSNDCKCIYGNELRAEQRIRLAR